MYVFTINKLHLSSFASNYSACSYICGVERASQLQYAKLHNMQICLTPRAAVYIESENPLSYVSSQIPA